MKYIVEHMEEDFSEWVTLEYAQILVDVGSKNFMLTSLPKSTTKDDIPSVLLEMGLQWTLDDCTRHMDITRACLMDPAASTDLAPADRNEFDYFVFGGILGSHPPIDRTSVLRKKYGLPGRRLGALQMTTDTAIRVTQNIIAGTPISEIKFIDYPEIRYNRHESTEMPFRYIDDGHGAPILPDKMLDLIKNDGDQTISGLL